MLGLRLGQVLNLKKAESWTGKSMFGFKAPKGTTFVAVFLGVEKDGESLDLEAAMKTLGWVPGKKDKQK